MQSLEGRHDGRRALIEVGIIPATVWERHRGKTQDEILEGVNPYWTLIDTGATSTMISRRVVSDLGMISRSVLPFRFLDGDKELPAHNFFVAFNPPTQIPESNTDKRARSTKISVCTKQITGGELPHILDFDVILGMDVLSTGVLWMRTNRRFSFTFG